MRQLGWFTLVLLVTAACHDTAVSPLAPTGVEALAATAAAATPAVDDTPEAPGACDIIGLDRKNVRVTVDGLQVTFYVPVANASYVDVWVPAINAGAKYTGPVNSEFTVNFAPGVYQYQLAVELRQGDGRLIQCDRHRGEFTVVAPPQPPRTPDPEPEPECEQIWVVDEEAWTELVTIREAYDETTCVPGQPVATGWVYKLTGGSPDTRESRCVDEFNIYHPDGTYEASAVIPGDGVVDACVFSTYPGSDDFERGLSNPKTRFRLYHTVTSPGEPVCTTVHHPAIVEVIQHPEVGHYECVGD